MSRFDKYRRESDLPELRKLEPGEGFTAELLGDHEFATEDNGPLPVLEFENADDGQFAWMASTWHALDQLALADPQPGDTVTVRRLSNRGRSHQFDIRVLRTRPAPSAQHGKQDAEAGGEADDSDLPF